MRPPRPLIPDVRPPATAAVPLLVLLVLPLLLPAGATAQEGGETVTRRVGVDAWLNGATRVATVVELPGGAPDGPVTVVVDPGHAFPDVDRPDNRWEGTP